MSLEKLLSEILHANLDSLSVFRYLRILEDSFSMPQSKRLLLDTSIYGIFAESEALELVEKIASSERIIVYGFSIVRKELRDTPKTMVKKGMKLRNILLSYYDFITEGHFLPLTRLIEVLAEEYLKSYDGGISKAKLKSDFMIVACASLNGLDILVSADNHSMFSKKAIEAYLKVNNQNGLRTPQFYSPKQLEQLL